MLYKQYFQSPLGKITLLASDQLLELAIFTNPSNELQYKKIPLNSNKILNQASDYLSQYFNGEQPQNPNFKMNICSSTFSQKVYHFLYQHCKYGSTISYKDLAHNINHPKALRAVGTACKNNRFIIFIPCHRVIAVNGQVNYAGGKDRKLALLALEQQHR